MKFYTSTFYAIRHMSPNMIPFSTAVFDPKWFHSGKDYGNIFIDKNGVLNGLRTEFFRPVNTECHGKENCKSYALYEAGTRCNFLSEYKRQLENLDFSRVKDYFSKCSELVRETIGYKGEPCIMLIVYESATNKCSEREVILEVLPEHGIKIEEWNWRAGI